jgi:elongation factor P
MATYNTSEFRKGLKVLIDGEPYLMIDMEFMKPGKGQAVYRTKLKNLLRGNVIDRNYRSGDSMDAAEVDEMSVQYLYNDSKNWHFMNQESFEQYSISGELLGDVAKWLKDGTNVEVTMWNGKPISIEPPKNVDLAVQYTEPAARGNTATNVQKPAKLETGADVFVPAFINIGDIVKINTETGEYIERVTKS